ncbi:melatonin receptor type 1B-B-like [Actinia tenebrosa]|uniref:Melatonin receptor type 1B-B-like n=1 Tax=Actinia tenebrosa TaxID=6105 RepID=A0A6P8HJ29_ACTTE|nr:melatonin receptor type 1B-B-like [Actinia tenebrosa]
MSNRTRTPLPRDLTELMSRGKLQVFLEVSILIFIEVVAIFGNLSVFYVIHRSPRLRNLFGMYMFFLALSDLLMATFIMPISLDILITSRQNFNNRICKFQGFFILVLAWSSLHIMVLMAVSRYFRVVKRSLYLRLFTKRSCLMMVIAVFVIAGVFVLLPILAGFAKFEFWPARAACFLTLNTSFPAIRRTCISFYILVYTILPLAVIGFCYYKVHTVVSAHKKAVFPQNAGAFCPSISVDEIRVTKTIFSVVFAFILCWIPSIIVEMLNSIYGSRSLPRWSYMIHVYLAYVSCATNPIIYGVTNKIFRKILRKSFGCLFRQDISVIQAQTINNMIDQREAVMMHEPRRINVRTIRDEETLF